MLVCELQKKFLPSLAPEDFILLLAHATGKEKVFLLAHPEYDITQSKETRAKSFFERRLQHEPIALIIGCKEFYGRIFIVTKDTLIPRPETELLVKLVLDRINNQKAKVKNQTTLVDVGTGSGNIIISLAKELENELRTTGGQLHAIDISKKALVVAKRNAQVHALDKNITFHHGDLLAPYIKKNPQSENHLIIIANLPYISQKMYASLQKDVRDFEPKSALVSGQAGLKHYYRLFDNLKTYSSRQKSTTLFLEISPEQKSSLKKCLFTLFPRAIIAIHKDLAHRDRIAEIHL